jgi:prophage antirepressor-like protein
MKEEFQLHEQIQIFESNEFGKLEVKMINGKPYFPATECAIMLGYSRPHDAISRHCRYSVKQGVPHPQSPDKIIEINFIPEGDLYRLIIRSKLSAAVRFEAWICDIILPSIRTHGAYITDKTLQRMREDRYFVDELIQRVSDEREKNNALQNYVNIIEPKAWYYDIILQCPDAVQASIVAKDYAMSAIRFNKLLHALEVQYKVGKTWLLYSRHEGKGYTVSKTFKKNGLTIISTCFTQAGRMWLYDLLKQHGILPEVEMQNTMKSSNSKELAQLTH